MSDFQFPVELVWPGGKRVIASVPGKPAIEIATPPPNSEARSRRPGAPKATDPAHEDDLAKAAVRAEDGCLVSAALRIPVRLTFVVDTETQSVTSIGRRS